MNRRQTELLQWICRVPLADALDLNAISGTYHPATMWRDLRYLETEGLVRSVRHSLNERQESSSRYYLTLEGLGRLAVALDTSVSDLVRRYPISLQWMGILSRRIDSMAVYYRLASLVGELSDGAPVRVEPRRRRAIDVFLTPIAEGRGPHTIAVMRQGLTLNRKAFRYRLRSVFLNPRSKPAAVLVITPRDSDRRYARRLIAYTSSGRIDSPLAFVSTESEAIRSPVDHPVWHPPGVSLQRYSLQTIIQEMVVALPPSLIEPPMLVQKATPLDTGDARLVAGIERHTAFLLTPAQKRVIDLLIDWPLMRRVDLAALAGMSLGRFGKVLVPLMRQTMMVLETNRWGAPRLALSDDGWEYTTLRDRASTKIALDHWGVRTVNGSDKLRGKAVAALDRNLPHTDSAYRFVATLARECADSEDYELRNLDPPPRSVRHFEIPKRVGEDPPASRGPREPYYHIQPDASGVLLHVATRSHVPFLLECENRASTPARAIGRIKPYQQYYRSLAPYQDYGALPLVLVVFDDVGAETTFLIKAIEEEQESGVTIPFATSCYEIVECYGVLGPSWKIPATLAQHSRARIESVRVSIWDPRDARWLPNRNLYREPPGRPVRKVDIVAHG